MAPPGQATDPESPVTTHHACKIALNCMSTMHTSERKQTLDSPRQKGSATTPYGPWLHPTANEREAYYFHQGTLSLNPQGQQKNWSAQPAIPNPAPSTTRALLNVPRGPQLRNMVSAEVVDERSHLLLHGPEL